VEERRQDYEDMAGSLRSMGENITAILVSQATQAEATANIKESMIELKKTNETQWKAIKENKDGVVDNGLQIASVKGQATGWAAAISTFITAIGLAIHFWRASK
jgi:phosphohistidine phosphatase SixA